MRIKLRYSTRFILLGMLVFALLLVPETRRARQQRRLVSDVERLGGVCERKAREWIPHRLRAFLSADYGSFIVKIRVGGYLATPRFGFSSSGRRAQVVSGREMDELLSSKAMRDVEDLSLYGTAISDDLVMAHIMAMPKLKFVEFRFTVVTEPCVEKLRESLPAPPACFVFCDRVPKNGPAALEMIHGRQLRLTRDLSLFRRAERGDAKAVAELLRLAGEHTISAAEPVVEAISKATSPEAIVALHDAMASNSPRVRRAAVEVLGAKRDFDALSKAVHDVDLDVRLEAVDGLAKVGGVETLRPLRLALEDDSPEVRLLALAAIGAIDDQRALLAALVMAVSDEAPEVRWAAVCRLERLPNEQSLEVLIQALRDEESTVRSAAARVLGKIPDARSVAALKKATHDDDSFVRRHAHASLRELESLPR